MNGWSVLLDLRLERNSTIVLNLFGQAFDHLFLLKYRAVEAIDMRLHWRLKCMMAAALPASLVNRIIEIIDFEVA